MKIIEALRDIVDERQKGHADEDFVVRGIWKTDLLFKPNENERTFEYTYVLMQTVGQGCSYCGEAPIIRREWMGQDARKLVFDQSSIEVAALDAIFSVFDYQPESAVFIEGSSIEKTRQRTQIVIDEVMKLADEVRSAGRRPRVTNVGVVGNFLKSLSALGVQAYATDMDRTIIGTQVGGVTVEGADSTLARVAEADIALVTGMALGNGTLDEIFQVARDNDTRIVMFNETGANLGGALCQIGIDCVVSEPFPFYIFQGQSRIDVYKRNR